MTKILSCFLQWYSNTSIQTCNMEIRITNPNYYIPVNIVSNSDDLLLVVLAGSVPHRILTAMYIQLHSVTFSYSSSMQYIHQSLLKTIH